MCLALSCLIFGLRNYVSLCAEGTFEGVGLKGDQRENRKTAILGMRGFPLF